MAGEQIILEHKTKALSADIFKEGSPVESSDKMHDMKGQYEKRLKEVGDLLGTPEEIEGLMTQEAKKYNGGKILVTVGGPFADMSSDMELLVGLIATALAEKHVSFYADSAKQAKGMFKQRTRKSLGQWPIGGGRDSCSIGGETSSSTDRRHTVLTRRRGGRSTKGSSSTTTTTTLTGGGSNIAA